MNTKTQKFKLSFPKILKIYFVAFLITIFTPILTVTILGEILTIVIPTIKLYGFTRNFYILAGIYSSQSAVFTSFVPIIALRLKAHKWSRRAWLGWGTLIGWLLGLIMLGVAILVSMMNPINAGQFGWDVVLYLIGPISLCGLTTGLVTGWYCSAVAEKEKVNNLQ